VCASTARRPWLGCEFAATRPAIALISFSAPNVTFMNPDQFRSELQVLVTDSLSQYGVIPVLATIPAGGNATTEQLAEYNRAIVEVGTQSGVPLWNLWRAMQERGISDPFSVAPEGAGNLTDPALSFGYNVRNLTRCKRSRPCARRQASSSLIRAPRGTTAPLHRGPFDSGRSRNGCDSAVSGSRRLRRSIRTAGSDCCVVSNWFVCSVQLGSKRQNPGPSACGRGRKPALRSRRLDRSVGRPWVDWRK